MELLWVERAFPKQNFQG